MDFVKFTMDHDGEMILCEGEMDGKPMTSGILMGPAGDTARFHLGELCTLVFQYAKRVEETSWLRSN